MIVDANAPDVLHQDGPDLGWLDEACKVKGDQLAVSGDEDVELEESEDELLFRNFDVKGKQRVRWGYTGNSMQLTTSPGRQGSGTTSSILF